MVWSSVSRQTSSHASSTATTTAPALMAQAPSQSRLTENRTSRYNVILSSVFFFFSSKVAAMHFRYYQNALSLSYSLVYCSFMFISHQTLKNCAASHVVFFCFCCSCMQGYINNTLSRAMIMHPAVSLDFSAEQMVTDRGFNVTQCR